MNDSETKQLEFDFKNVQAEIVSESSDELRLELGEFAGPLDLLLYLIRREQANIFDIPIARITDKYLSYIKMMERLDIAVAGEFLVMAATLIEIKSKMLLPQEPVEEGEEETLDPRQELVDRLLEHQKFKLAAESLWTRATVEQAVFTRGTIETDENNPEISATVFDLFEAFQKIMVRHKEQIELEIHREEMSLAEMLRNLKARLKIEKRLNLTKVFGEMGSRRELILAFISVLEIVRTEAVALFQKNTFEDITLELVES
ncbi:MAG: chromosome segregation protein ScpA [Acidobacteria bacterium]|nr:MAG: chromosome segregation protein ScpA [Acidobacteriota bacterium]REK02684.1 MAG: chromosome segregation protein ScpA [Acidobacteriota bacterium]REK13511.1 MAG: chromosome segregation protein ScpA [Acidobacteriota bacterium]REK41505.1 MAG: chromosome segregation protein ScpA [Acidobacteriota bacterium]